MTLSGLPKRLIDEGLLLSSKVDMAWRQAEQEGISFMSFLIRHQLVDNKALLRVASAEFGIPAFDISALDIVEEVTKLVSDKLVRQFNALPIFKRGKKLYVAISDPANLQALDQFKFHSGLNTEAILVENYLLEKVIVSALENGEASTLAEFSEEDLDQLEFSDTDEDNNVAPVDSDVDDAPLVRFVNKVLLDAINMGASDIHFEPYEKRFRVRCRADGMLQEVVTPPTNLASRIAARLKVMARLNIAERRVPQDGRIKLQLSRHRAIDFRVNTCPTLFGEKVVLRILDASDVHLGVDSLGYDEDQKKAFLEAIHRPHGMVLVTGPTGSGKTVSLYTALSILNTTDRNICAAEDPSEIYLPGVNQLNINDKVGLTFATALRSFLRQDPDIIMVGEIRDQETAEIAIKAAQTGHMVLSTLHTNDAPQTLSRLLNMGVEPYNIVSAVSLIVAQRLARRLCDKCKQIVELPEEVLLSQGFTKNDIGRFTLYGPDGCSQCNNGYRGRVGIFQVMPVSDEMGDIIINGGNSSALAQQAEKEGIDDLRRSGLKKVMVGVTSLDEINRVTTE